MEDRRSYVYVYFRSNGQPLYIGKGVGQRWSKHERQSQNTHLASIIKLAGGSLPRVKIREGLTHKEALLIEAAFINALGREIDGGPLINLTLGGEGTNGVKMNDEWRSNRSAKAKEMWKNPDIAARISESRKGNTYRRGKKMPDSFKNSLSERMRGNSYTKGLALSEEHRAAVSKAHKGRKQSEAHIAARMKNAKGRKRTPEHQAALTAALRGRKMSDQAKANISAATKGRPKSEETKAKMREAWRRRKEAGTT